MSNLRKLSIKSLSENTEILLPVTPFVKYKEAITTNSQDLFGFGETDGGSSVKLDTWSIESFFPDIDNNYSFDLSSKKYHPNLYIIALSRWMKEQHVLEFNYYTDEMVLNYYLCKINGFEHGEKSGNKDVYYTLDFKEYKQLKIGSQYVKYASTEEITKSYGSSYYVVGEGDTLITIAAKIYGDSTKWSYLMNNNNIKNPTDIFVGQGLKL